MPVGPEEFVATSFTFLVTELAGFARAFGSRPDEEMAHFLVRYYGLLEHVIGEHGGRVVKFMGDAALAVFPAEQSAGAVSAAVALEGSVQGFVDVLGIPVVPGANVHSGTAVEMEVVRGEEVCQDVVGQAVNEAFLLGKGPGIRISDPVYRKLPDEERSPWTRDRPWTAYTLGGAGAGGGPGLSEEESMLRW